jgi:hypothetical protein
VNISDASRERYPSEIYNDEWVQESRLLEVSP